MKFFVSIICVLLFTSLTFSQSNPLVTKEKTPLIIYGSNTCHYCIDTKLFLKEKNIEFIFYDIDLSESKLNEMLKKLSTNGVDISNVKLPVIDKSGKLFMNDSKFQDFLKMLVQ
ncbi:MULTISPECIES: glutaredoxin family protein [Croceibacter]|uniref:glutaredoxin family protein n=1 Tax=Croceibacter TaxID=216431 RepID=UPI000C592FC1|nr:MULTISPECIES: glutaredoxin family protein [Croceibacter]MAM22710.1 hypothetical protein [Croceibacter sp.]MBG24497.1 hypothetical protein [Croceibacter sp.]|tara:strand:- start:1812 stop:2153 length:342 start_codon:yes stop_codon:yes gene_type:complete